MTFLHQLWNRAGGEVPGGLWPLAACVAAWTLLVLLVIRPTGFFRRRGMLLPLFGGLALLLGGHILLRALLTPPRGEDVWVLWPLRTGVPGLGEGLAVVEEEYLGRQGSAGEALEAADPPHRLLCCRYLFGEGSGSPGSAAEWEELIRALGARRLVEGEIAGEVLRLRRWSIDWDLLQAPIEAEYRLGGTGNAPESLREIQQLYHNFVAQQLGLEVPPPGRRLRAETLPLFMTPRDSAALYLELPDEYQSYEDRLRAADLLLHMDAPGERARILRTLKEGRERADSAGVEYHLLAAAFHAREDQWPEVIRSLKEALRADPHHPRCYWLISHLNRGSLASFGFDSRLKARREAVRLQPAFPPALIPLARELADLGRGGEAAELVDRALVCLPDHEELLLQRANLAYRLFDHERAILIYLRLLERMPDDPRPWKNLGQVYYVLQKYAEAIPCLERAVALGSTPHLLHLLGVSHRKLGDRDKAIHYFRRRMKLGGDPAELERTRRQLAGMFPELQP